MERVELLSPVGNMESLYQAVANGADAVYLGGKRFGARAYASNFDYEDMVQAIRYCHLYGVKIYVTVNTVIFEEELKEVLEYVKFLHKNNVDAIIVQDIGLMSLIRKKFPNLEIHASTQCHNHNESGISLLYELGVKRVVMAREMSLEEIQKIAVPIEKEIFVHGALCVCYSGCCLFSSMNGGRSGNRGECVGSCRLPYQLYCNDRQIPTDGTYLLSTKSLCTLNHIPELIEAKITSFKIEGRMKSPEYVGYVTRLYREKIDEYYHEGKNTPITEEELRNLKVLYHRGFTDGYLFHQQGNTLMNIKTSNHIGIPLGKVISIDSKKIKIKLSEDFHQEDGIRFDDGSGMIVNKLYNQKGLLVNSLSKGELALIDNKIGLRNSTLVFKTVDKKWMDSLKILPERKIDISINCILRIGQCALLSVSDSSHVIELSGKEVMAAERCPVTKERLKEQLEKLGNTPFRSVDTRIEMDQNIFIGMKEVNELRRDAINRLMEERMTSRKVLYQENSLFETTEQFFPKKEIYLHVLVRNEEQLQAALDEKVDYIYVLDKSLYFRYQHLDSVYYRTKRVANRYSDIPNKHVLASELGAVSHYGKDHTVISDYFLNVTNSSSVAYLIDHHVKLVTLSVENSLENVSKIAQKCDQLVVVIYGRVELMVSKYCPLSMVLNCDRKKGSCCKEGNYSLKDIRSNCYPLVLDQHFCHILDSKNMNLITRLKDYQKIGISHFRLDLFDEDRKKVIKLIREVRNESLS